MNDFLDYMKCDPLFRAGRHGELTFSMVYAYSEHFILSLSHDEVVHGKSAMVGKMPGDIPEKFANLRAAYGYMMMHPGKKLLFMGQDFGEFDEWNEERSIEWDLLKYDDHKNMHQYMTALNELYKSHPALYTMDENPDGFEWINNISGNENTLVFIRKTGDAKESLVVVCNFSGVDRKGYKIGVPYAGKYKEIFNSDLKNTAETDLAIQKHSAVIWMNVMKEKNPSELLHLHSVSLSFLIRRFQKRRRLQ